MRSRRVVLTLTICILFCMGVTANICLADTRQSSSSLSVPLKHKVATPTFDPDGGTYDDENLPQVTISCSTGDVSIYYTTNGTDPTEQSTLYTGPFYVTSSCTLKAKAYKTGLWFPSDIATSDPYTIQPVTYDYVDSQGQAYSIDISSLPVSPIRVAASTQLQISASCEDLDDRLVGGEHESYIHDALTFQWTVTGGTPTSWLDESPTNDGGVYTSTLTWTAPSQPGSYMVTVRAIDEGDPEGTDDPETETQVCTIEVQVLETVFWQPNHTYASPISADIDGDDCEELIIVGDDGNVYVWNDDGTLVTGWPKSISAGYSAGLTSWPSVAVGDIDDDDDPEVVVGSPDSPYVYAFNSDGTAVSGWPMQTKYGFRNSPTIADVDCDDILDVVAVDAGGNVYVWKWNDHPDSEQQASILSMTISLATEPVEVSSSPVVADINFDGVMDIIIGSITTEKLYAFDGGTGDAVTDWPKTLGGGIESTPAIADFDGDDEPDIAVGCNDGKVYVYHPNASTSFTIDVSSPVKSSPAVADLDSGGKDIIFASEEGKLYAYHGVTSGGVPVLVTDWPTGGLDLDSGDVYSSPVVGNLDGDADPEIAIGTDGGELLIIEKTGTITTSYEVVGMVRGAPLLADLDDDDATDLVAGATTGSIHRYDLPAGTYNSIMWPTFRHDKSGAGADFSEKAENGSIAGVVTISGTNTVLPGVAIQILDSEDQPVSGATDTTGNDGSYVVTKLPVGQGVTYKVRGTKDGFTTTTSDSVSLNQAGQFERENLAMPQTDSQAPTISNASPTSTITDMQPEISADITDTGGAGIDSDSIVMRVDKRRVDHDFSSGEVTYTPEVALSYGLHTVELEVDDNANNGPSTAVWSFIVQPQSGASVSEWSMFMHDALHTGILGTLPEMYDDGRETLDLAWYAETPTCQEGDLSARHLNPGGNTEILEHPYLDSSPVFYELTNGTPVVCVGLFEEDGNQIEGGLRAFNATTGSVIWDYYPSSNNRGGVAATPVVATISGGAKRILCATEDGYMVSVNAETGAEVWAERTETSNHKPIYGSPVVGDGVVYYSHERGELWGLSIEDSPGTRVILDSYGLAGADSKVGPSSIAFEQVGSAKYLYVGTDAGRLYKVQVDGTPQISASVALGGPVESSPAIVDGVAYVGVTLDKDVSSAYNLYAIDTTDFSVKWKVKLDSECVTTPSVGFDQVFVGTHNGTVYALDQGTGEVEWSKNIGNYILSSCSLSASGIVYVACCDDDDPNLDNSLSGSGTIYAFNAVSESDEPEPKATYEPTYTGNTSFRSAPCIAYIENSTTGRDERWVYITSRAESDTETADVQGTLFAFRTQLLDRIEVKADPYIYAPGIIPQEVTIKPGEQVILTCSAYDNDSRYRNGVFEDLIADQVTWTWEPPDIENYSLSVRTGETFTWTAPDAEGDYEIRCIVDDMAIWGSESNDAPNFQNVATIHVEPSPRFGEIRGTVTDDSQTPVPIEGALVVAGPYWDETDENGRYVLPNVENGSYTVTATKELYSPDQEDVLVQPSNPTVQVDLVLSALFGKISGYVHELKNESGAIMTTDIPIVGATVQMTDPSRSTVTDDMGYYVFEEVPSGTRTLSASKTGYALRDEEGNPISSVNVGVTSGEAASQNFWLEAVDVTSPAASNLTPTPSATGQDGRVTISCTLTDESGGSGIDLWSIRLTVDGNEVQPVINPSDYRTANVSYKPIGTLIDGEHEVSVTCTDKAGNRLTTYGSKEGWCTWSFSVTSGVTGGISWPMFHKDAKNSGYIDGPEDDPLRECFNVRWFASNPAKQRGAGEIFAFFFPGAADMDSSPVFSSETGHVYAGTCIEDDSSGLLQYKGDLKAYEATTGELVWKYPADTVSGSTVTSNYIGAVVSAPCVALVGSEYRAYFLSSDGYVYCVRASDNTTSSPYKYKGELCWRFPQSGSPLRIYAAGQSSPVIDSTGSTIYFTARTSSSETQNYIYAVNAVTGQLKWVYNLLAIGGVFASPALDGSGSLYTRVGLTLFGLNNLGSSSPTLKFSETMNPGGLTLQELSSPAISSDGSTLYCSAGGSAMQAFSTSDGDSIWAKWSPDGGEIASTPAVDSSQSPAHIYSGACSGDSVDLYLDQSGSEYDASYSGDRSYVTTSPAATGNGIIYAACNGFWDTSTPGAIYAVTPEYVGGNWYMQSLGRFDIPLDPDTDPGEYNGVLHGRSSPCVGYILNNGSVERWVYIVLRSYGGRLYAFGPDPNQEAPSLIASGTSGLYVSVRPGQRAVVMERLHLRATGGQIKVSSLTLTKTGTAGDSWVEQIRLYKDTAKNGKIDANDTLMGSGTFSSGSTQFSFTTPITIGAGETIDLLAVYDIKSQTVTPDLTLGVEVTNASAISVQSGASVSSLNFPIDSSLVSIEEDAYTYGPGAPINVSVGPESIWMVAEQSVLLQAIAKDFDDLLENGEPLSVVEDAVQFTWSASSGWPTSDSDDIYIWTAPYESGTYTITLTADDAAIYGSESDDPSVTKAITVYVLSDEDNSMVTGTVSSSLGGELPGVVVTLSKTGFSQTVVTGADGTYSFNDLVLGTYTIYFDGTDVQHNDHNQQVYITEPGVKVIDPTLTADPELTWKNISGTVVISGTSTGIPDVTVFDGSSTAGGIIVTTDENGDYSLDVRVITLGEEHTIYATHPDYVTNSIVEEVDDDITDADISLTALYGRVVGTVSTGSPPTGLEGAIVTVTNEWGGIVSTATTDEDGDYIAGRIPTGTYTARVTRSGFNPAESDPLSVTVGSDTTYNCSLTSDDSTDPVISDISPADASTTGDATPLVSATILDEVGGSGVDPDSVILYLDANNPPTTQRGASYDAETGLMTYTVSPALSDGTYYAKIEASDLNGNSTSESWSFSVAEDTSDPTATLNAPVDSELITGDDLDDEGYDVYATIDDDSLGSQNVTYWLEVQASGASFTSDWITVATDELSSSLSNQHLCYWNTRALANGRYKLRLRVQDTGGNEAEDWIVCTVQNNLKIGQFKYPEEPDISVNFREGVPFEVRRIYNSNNIENVPFYYGWGCSYDLRVEEDLSSYDTSVGWLDYNLVPFGDRATVRLPDGESITFTTEANQSPNLYNDPVYTAPPGVLYVLHRSTEQVGEETYVAIFTLTDKQDVTYQSQSDEVYYSVTAPEENPVLSKLVSIYDRCGSTVTINEASSSLTRIEADDGRVIDLTKSDGRITKAEFKSSSGGSVIQTVDYAVDPYDARIYRVTKEGPLANTRGELATGNVVYEYRYDDNYRLTDIIRPNQAGHPETPYIQNEYDTDGTLKVIKEWVHPTFYREKTNEYSIDSGVATTTSDVSVGISTNSTQTVTQSEDSAVTGLSLTPSDEMTPIFEATLTYDDEDPREALLPTTITREYDFDGDEDVDELTTNLTYTNGDMTYSSQSTSLGTVETSYAYGNTVYNHLTFHCAYQGYGGGNPVKVFRTFGTASGEYPVDDEDEKYLVRETHLLSGENYNLTEYLYYSTENDPPDSDAVNGLLKSVTGPENDSYRVRTKYEYDDYGHTTRIKTCKVIDTTESEEVVTSRMVHDARGNIVLEGSGRGMVTKYTYDSLGRRYKAETFTDTTWRTRSSFTVNDYTSVPETTTLTGYDKNGNAVYSRTRDADGNVLSENQTSYYMDNSTQWNSDLLTGVQSSTALAYDTAGTGYSSTQITTGMDSTGQTIAKKSMSHFDEMGRMDQSTMYDSDGSTVLRTSEHEYFADGKKKSTATYDGSENLLSKAEYLYDELGRMTSQKTYYDASNYRTLTKGYDAVGNLTEETDAEGNTHAYVYDNANRLVAEYFPNSSSLVMVAYEYYDDGQLYQKTEYDNDGSTELAVTRYEYDKEGRLYKVKLWKGGDKGTSTNWAVTQYDYKDHGSEYTVYVNGIGYSCDFRITDAEGRYTYYQHDDLGRVTMILYPTGLREVIEYYSDGRKKSRSTYDRTSGGVDFQKVTYNYDTAGRMSSKQFPGDSVSSPNRIEYTYDSFGKLAQITDKRSTGAVGGTDTITYTYDILGRVTCITRWDGVTLNYTYNSAGQRASIEVKNSSGTRTLYTRYVYDLMGRLSEVYEDNGGSNEKKIAEYTYDKDGSNNPRQTVTYYDGASSIGSRTYVSDSIGRLISVTNVANSTTVSSFDYTTDGIGRRTYVDEFVDSPISQTEDYLIDYEYDKLGRLIDWDVNTGSIESDYTFDDVGNRLTQDEETYSYINASLYNSSFGATVSSDILAADGTYTYSYDANGSLIKRAVDSNNYRLYYYDWEQRLTKIEDYVSGELDKTVEYKYDPMGSLIQRTEDESSTTTYVQDIVAGLSVVLIEETSSYTAKYTYGADRLKVSRSGEYYYFYDGLGSTRTITNTSGTVKARYVYDVYGKPLSSESYEDASVTGQPFLFTGELYDPDTEHVYLRARWYDPGIGRFLTRDTYKGQFNEPLSLHRYGYCGGDPSNRTDPSGYFFGGGVVETLVSIAIIGAAAGAVGAHLVSYATTGRAATLGQVLQGMAIGAFAAPVCVLEPPVGVILSVIGIIESIGLVHQVWTDPSASIGQKIAAGTILVATLVGAKAAMKYAAKAHTSGMPGELTVRTPTNKPPPPPSTPKRTFVSAGDKLIEIPKGWQRGITRKDDGIFYQKPGSTGNSDMIRIMDGNTQYPKGRIIYYNKHGQPLDVSKGVPKFENGEFIGQTGSKATMHFDLDY